MVSVKRIFRTRKPAVIAASQEPKKILKPRIRVMDYGNKTLEEKEMKIEDCLPVKDKPSVTWINVDGLDGGTIEALGKQFSLHPLILEDILNVNQRPKIENFGDHVFIVLKMITFDEKESEIKTEQISLVLGQNFVLSIQETPGDMFDPIRERIRNEKSRIRKNGSDYLTYTLIDAIVDSYFLVLEKLGEKIGKIEDSMLKDSGQEILHSIHMLKSEMIFLRKSVWPLREIISKMERDESPLIKKTTHVYLRDVYDNTIQVIDAVETFRDSLSSLIDISLSSISNKLNEVMKVLTIIATVFIPLTFITGIYGMNFEHMPELGWHMSYPMLLVAMAVIALSMLLFFRRRRWI